MTRPQGIRRFLRFSLRSLLLLTLAIATWLGYEVHQARTVQRQAEAIRALGGEVEFEPSPWSLLRFVEPETYGWRIVAAEIPGERADDAVSVLKSLTRLRELRVEYDGTFDLQPSWCMFNRELRATRIIAINAQAPHEPESVEQLAQSILEQEKKEWKRFKRIAEKSRANKRLPERLRVFIDEHLGSTDSPELAYLLLPLGDAHSAELFVVAAYHCKLDEEDRLRGAILLVDDLCVDAKAFSDDSVDFSARDVDGDGVPELAIEYIQSVSRARYRPQALPGDPRLWLGLYAIEPTGFRSLLPDDRLKE